MSEKKTIAIIPARYSSSRFPGKPLALINGRPMIEWVYKKVSLFKGIDLVYVATDDKRIMESIQAIGGNAILTSGEHESGTDRLAECTRILKLNENDLVLNIQGDEPLISQQIIDDLIKTTQVDGFEMGTLAHKISKKEDITNPNVVKVVIDQNGCALYFSRSPIPYCRNTNVDYDYFKHMGVYAYKVDFLQKFSTWEKTKLEAVEGLEQLRVMERGHKIHVGITEAITVGVDTPEQLKLVEKIMRKDELI